MCFLYIGRFSPLYYAITGFRNNFQVGGGFRNKFGDTVYRRLSDCGRKLLEEDFERIFLTRKFFMEERKS
jgi:hypothetical protein